MYQPSISFITAQIGYERYTMCLSGGELVDRDGRMMKIFYGMSSSTAMKKHAGGVAEYR